MNSVEIFKPGLSVLRELADKYRGITINGVEDVAGYDAAKEAKKELARWRIDISKAGKGFREEALTYQREVLRQEKEHLDIITPIEDALKAQIDAVEEAKAREERKVLLPSRKALLGEINANMSDDDIIALDEKSFSEMYMSLKTAHLEKVEADRVATENEKRRQEELEKAKEEAAAKAVEEEKSRAENERLAEEKRKAEEEARKVAEAERIERENADELAKAEKNRKYKAWLKEHGVVEGDETMKVERVGSTFVLWKKVSEITIA